VAFGTPVTRVAGNMQAGIRAYEGGQCFIATELYGGDSDQVAILRRFRDRVPLSNYLGRRFVTAYYRLGPRIIKVMRRSTMVRFLLQAVVGLLLLVVRPTQIALVKGGLSRDQV